MSTIKRWNYCWFVLVFMKMRSQRWRDFYMVSTMKFLILWRCFPITLYKIFWSKRSEQRGRCSGVVMDGYLIAALPHHGKGRSQVPLMVVLSFSILHTLPSPGEQRLHRHHHRLLGMLTSVLLLLLEVLLTPRLYHHLEAEILSVGSANGLVTFLLNVETGEFSL